MFQNCHKDDCIDNVSVFLWRVCDKKKLNQEYKGSSARTLSVSEYRSPVSMLTAKQLRGRIEYVSAIVADFFRLRVCFTSDSKAFGVM